MSSEIDVLTVEELTAAAQKVGCTLVGPLDDLNVLTFDIDGEADYHRHVEMRDLLKEIYAFDALAIEEWSSRHGGGRCHVVIHLNPGVLIDTMKERLLIQAAMRSDGMREMLALRRVKIGAPALNCLFKPEAKK